MTVVKCEKEECMRNISGVCIYDTIDIGSDGMGQPVCDDYTLDEEGE